MLRTALSCQVLPSCRQPTPLPKQCLALIFFVDIAGHKAYRCTMPLDSPALSDAFEGCRTIQDADATYKRLFGTLDGRQLAVFAPLSDAHRRAMERITQTMRGDSPSAPDEEEDRASPRLVRNWCRMHGIVVPRKGRVPVRIENEYRAAMGMEPLPGGRRAGPRPRPAASDAAIRAWASDAGMTVGHRGRVPTEVLVAYAECHPE